MKGLEAVSSREICINGKEIGFDYKIGHVVISLDKIFVSLNVLDYVVMGKDTLQAVDTKPMNMNAQDFAIQAKMSKGMI